VQALRDFRDAELLTNAPGQAFVAWYYRNSPPLAAWIAKDEDRRAAARLLLWPLFMAASESRAAAGVAVLVLLTASLVAIRRRNLRREPC
jgi:hypothetical protein